MVARGISKKKLAIEAGLGAGYVHDLFRAKSKNPQSDHLAKLANALGCSVEDLTHPAGTSGDTEGEESSDPAGILPLFPDDVVMIRLWRFLPKRAKDLVLLRISELLPEHLRPKRPGDDG